jgi:hypothetical protein
VGAIVTAGVQAAKASAAITRVARIEFEVFAMFDISFPFR